METYKGRIREQSKKYPKMNTLMHHISTENLRLKHSQQKPEKATGIDGINKEKYEINLEENLEILQTKMRKFQYKPQGVKRVQIPKENGETRPLGIPAYEDRLVQGVMADILTEIYEVRFLDNSYGFRPKRNCHQAIKEINRLIGTKRVNYIIDADIKGFFNQVDHKWMMQFLEHDIADRNFLRYIVRMLKSGIWENMQYYESDKGTPQGGLISPVLANVYLHYVLDTWFEVIKQQVKGEAYLVRYADDFVILFEYESEANRIYKQLRMRLAKFNLELSEDKTRIIPFGKQTESKKTFDFLGFKHINGKTRNGKYRVHHRTSSQKMKQKRQAVKLWLHEQMHKPIDSTMKTLKKKLQGHYNYYGINGNGKSLEKFHKYTKETCYRIFNRRHQKRSMSWEIMERIWQGYEMPRPRICVSIW